jgi:uncharacterized protein (TIGR00251 family)
LIWEKGCVEDHGRCPVNIEIKVITNAKKREIIAGGPELKVKLMSLPRDGRANEELIEYLSSCFNVRKSDIKIIRGEKERKKVVALPVDDATFRAFLHERVKVTTG